jgi:hypothetical protein
LLNFYLPLYLNNIAGGVLSNVARKGKRKSKRIAAMAQAADYRKRAEECVEIAQTVRTQSQRIMLLHISDTWLRLANDAEDNSSATAVKSPRAPVVM